MDTRQLNGRYPGKVIDGGLAKTSGGNEQVALLCEITGEGPAKGTKLTYYGSFSDKAFEQTVKALRAAGFESADLSELDNWKAAVPNPPDVEFVIEQEPMIDMKTGEQLVDEETNEPLTRARIRWINPAARIGVKERLSGTESKSFAERMKGRLLAFDANNRGPKTTGAPAKPGARPSPPKPAADPGDIPF